jgi:hypothetical protein
VVVHSSLEASKGSQPNWQKAPGVELAESTDVQAIVEGEMALTECLCWEDFV